MQGCLVIELSGQLNWLARKGHIFMKRKWFHWLVRSLFCCLSFGNYFFKNPKGSDSLQMQEWISRQHLDRIEFKSFSGKENPAGWMLTGKCIWDRPLFSMPTCSTGVPHKLVRNTDSQGFSVRNSVRWWAGSAIYFNVPPRWWWCKHQTGSRKHTPTLSPVTSFIQQDQTSWSSEKP